jgi:hypothetical protein
VSRSPGAFFVWLPLRTGIVIALALRYLAGGDPLIPTPRWWSAQAVGIIFVIVVTVLRIGPDNVLAGYVSDCEPPFAGEGL